TPDDGFTGEDSFTYTVDNGYDGTATATVTVVVTDDPIGVDDEYTVLHDQTLVVPAGGVLVNDITPNGGPLTASLVSGPSDGTLTLNEDGSLVYIPDTGFVGTDSFTYEPYDGGAGNLTTVTIDVTDDPPPPSGGEASTDEDTPVDIPVVDNGGDPFTILDTSD